MWIDLEEGILDEFSERASFDADEFVKDELIAHSMTTFRRSARDAQPKNCIHCGTEHMRDVPTCSTSCRKAHEYAECVKAKVCVKCKVRPSRKTAKMCVECSGREDVEPQQKERGPRTIRCNGPNCMNQVLVGAQKGKTPRFCCQTCKNREMDRRKRENRAGAKAGPGDKVLIVSSESDHPTVARSVTLMIGKRGRVVCADSERVYVRFYGGERHAFRPSELCVLS